MAEFDLNSELPANAIKEIEGKVASTDFGNCLTECPVKVPGQNFALVSFVGPDCSQKAKKAGFRVLGAFSTKEEASSHARRVMKAETTFSLFVCDMYNWCICTPDETNIKEKEVIDEQLQTLLVEHNKAMVQGKLEFDKRKELLMKKHGEPSST